MAHLLTDIGLSLHGSYNSGERQDILTYEEGLNWHYERVSTLLSSEPVLSDAAKNCIREDIEDTSCIIVDENGQCVSWNSI